MGEIGRIIPGEQMVESSPVRDQCASLCYKPLPDLPILSPVFSEGYGGDIRGLCQ